MTTSPDEPEQSKGLWQYRKPGDIDTVYGPYTSDTIVRWFGPECRPQNRGFARTLQVRARSDLQVGGHRQNDLDRACEAR
jgi:hypothetical protein